METEVQIHTNIHSVGMATVTYRLHFLLIVSFLHWNIFQIALFTVISLANFKSWQIELMFGQM